MIVNNAKLINLSNTATKPATFSLFTLLSLLPTLALAHPGHGLFLSDGSFSSSVLSGVIHPLTGLDHLMLALGMGILFSQMHSFKKGFASLSIGLIAGFALSLSVNLNSQFVEAGIMLSIVLLTIALMSRYFNPALTEHSQTSVKTMYNTVIFGFGALAMFHGAAHAIEVPANSITTGFFIGMIVAMLGLYAFGSVMAKHLINNIQNSMIVQRVMAVVGLCAVLFS